MQKNLKQRKQEGFTIIEVLIVLAIAGLIMLVVFLAVPALQRNTRNTERRSDVNNIISSVQESLGNNNGVLPTSNGNYVTIFPGVAPNYGYYDASTPANITYTYQSTKAVPSYTASVDTIKIANFAKCNAQKNAVEPVASSTATKRSIVALFAVESNTGSAVRQCVDI